MLGRHDPIVEAVPKLGALLAEELTNWAVFFISDEITGPCPHKTLGPVRFVTFPDPRKPDRDFHVVHKEHIDRVLI
jgi:hypothetical protein